MYLKEKHYPIKKFFKIILSSKLINNFKTLRLLMSMFGRMLKHKLWAFSFIILMLTSSLLVREHHRIRIFNKRKLWNFNKEIISKMLWVYFIPKPNSFSFLSFKVLKVKYSSLVRKL